MTDSNNSRFVIGTIHHFSCTGGTLISKCLTVMPDVVFLSEIHPGHVVPGSFNPYDPIPQFSQYDLMSAEELENVFLDRVEVIVNKCVEHDKKLIIRDHSHTDFLSGLVPRRRLIETLTKRFDVRSIATFRNPIDSWLAMRANKWGRAVRDFEDYCQRYMAFSEMYRDCSRFRYEDFVQDPETLSKEMCEALGISFNSNFRQEFHKVRMSGNSGRSSPEIQPRPRRKHRPSFATEVNQSDHFLKICQLLGYEGL